MKKSILCICATVCASTHTLLAETILVPADYSSIQAGINASEDGDTVLVSSGVYYETVNFVGKHINVESESGAASTTINGSTGSGSIVSVTSGEAEVELHGFTIKRGDANNGSGVYVENSSLTISNCIITSNVSSSNGGGIYVDTGTLHLVDVVIEDNISKGAGGGLYLKYSNGSMTGGSISGNVGVNGGGVYLKDGSGEFSFGNITIENNEVQSNGGGIYAKNSPISIDSVQFLSNESNRGGGLFSWSGGDGTVSDSVFEGNLATDVGGGANIRSSEMTFTNCTFESNIADSDCDGNGTGAAIDSVNSDVTVENVTVCANLLCEVENDFSGTILIIGDPTGCNEGEGACCGGSACWVMEEAGCLDGGGVFQGGGSVCEIVECEAIEESGACCLSTTCVVTSENGCTDAGGDFQGIDKICEEVDCGTPCQADIDGNGVVNVDDLVYLISLWGSCP